MAAQTIARDGMSKPRDEPQGHHHSTWAALELRCRLLGCHLLAHPLYCADAYAKLAGRAYNAFPIR